MARPARPGAAGAGRVQRGSGLRRPGRRARLRGTGRRGARGRRDRRPRPAARFRGAGREDRRPAARPGAGPGPRAAGVGTDGGPEGGAVRALRRPGRRGGGARRPHRARAHARRPGRDGPARPRPRIRAAVGGRDGRGPPALLAAAARRPARDDPAGLRRSGAARWDDRGTTTRLHAGGCAPRCCRCWRRCSAGVWRRRSPAPRRCRGGPGCAGRAGRHRAGRPRSGGVRTAAAPGARTRPCRRRCAGGCCAAGSARPVCPTSRPSTCARWMPSSPAGGGGGGRPAGRRRRRPGVWQAAPAVRSGAGRPCCLHPTISRSPRVTRACERPCGAGSRSRLRAGHRPRPALSEEQIQAKIGELAEQVARDYRVGRCCSSACSRAPSSS